MEKNKLNKTEPDIGVFKVLIVFRESGATDNLFVPILCDAIRQQGIDVRCSIEEFWNPSTHYNIIHFQWPEEVVGWNCNDPSVIQRLEKRIAHFRAAGAHFVYTRHNTRPHYGNPLICRAYEVIEANTDVVVHMGEYSRKEYLDLQPGSQNVIIPHHLYEHTYKEDISIERARQKLLLPQSAFIVVAFGKFRNREEACLAVNGFRRTPVEDKLLLAPRLYPFSRQNPYPGRPFKRWCSRLGYRLLIPLFNRWFNLRGGPSDEVIDNCDLPYYLAAADVVFIARKEELNTSDIQLAFLFRKVVVGPDSGNIGELLHETGNPTFHPGDQYRIAHALLQARRLSHKSKGEMNYNYAMSRMSPKKVGTEYAQLYNELVERKRSVSPPKRNRIYEN